MCPHLEHFYKNVEGTAQKRPEVCVGGEGGRSSEAEKETQQRGWWQGGEQCTQLQAPRGPLLPTGLGPSAADVGSFLCEVSQTPEAFPGSQSITEFCLGPRHLVVRFMIPYHDCFKEILCISICEYKFQRLLAAMLCIHLAHRVSGRTEAESREQTRKKKKELAFPIFPRIQNQSGLMFSVNKHGCLS